MYGDNWQSNPRKEDTKPSTGPDAGLVEPPDEEDSEDSDWFVDGAVNRGVKRRNRNIMIQPLKK